MGCADLVPGVSGGTLAFIFGIYDQLLEALASLRMRNIGLAFFKQHTHLRKLFLFLVTLLSGIVFAFFSLSQLVHFWLNHMPYREYLYSAFSGLILGSIVIFLKKVTYWNQEKCLYLFLGFLIAFGVNFFPSLSVEASTGWFYYSYLFIAGTLCASAMLLPGISGSYLLLLLGVYSTVIYSLANFCRQVLLWNIPWDSLAILAPLAGGILFGLLYFSKIIHWALKNHHDRTFVFLVGVMIGALPSVWPFYVLKVVAGKIVPLYPVLPNLKFSTFLSLSIALSLFFVMIILEFLILKRYRSKL